MKTHFMCPCTESGKSRKEGPGARGQEGRSAEGPSEGEERRDARRTGESQELKVCVEFAGLRKVLPVTIDSWKQKLFAERRSDRARRTGERSGAERTCAVKRQSDGERQVVFVFFRERVPDMVGEKSGRRDLVAASRLDFLGTIPRHERRSDSDGENEAILLTLYSESPFVQGESISVRRAFSASKGFVHTQLFCPERLHSVL